MIDTAIWYRVAYTVVAAVYIGYTISLVVRSRRTLKRYEELRARGARPTS
jgi:type VI protein secretion system component VasF